MVKIFLGLGSNIGSKKENIKKAGELLKDRIQHIHISSYYLTRPIGFTNQDNFMNIALVGETILSPEELLVFIKDVEKKVGRIKRFKNGPREIDIDILFYDNLIYKNDSLVIPHPAIQDRDFVLRPLMDLDKDFVHPKLKNTIEELYLNIRETDKTILD